MDIFPGFRGSVATVLYISNNGNAIHLLYVNVSQTSGKQGEDHDNKSAINQVFSISREEQTLTCKCLPSFQDSVS